MSIEEIDKRANLAGQNRVEMLLFKIGVSQTFAINVFKVREVINAPDIHSLPSLSDPIKGVAYLRGHPVPVVDLAEAIGLPSLGEEQINQVIVTEYNRMVQGFLLSEVDRIVNVTWDSILSPPKNIGGTNYVTAVMHVDDDLVEILDVEKVLSEIFPRSEELSSEVSCDAGMLSSSVKRHVLFCDDSSVARHQVRAILDQMSFTYEEFVDGYQLLNRLREIAVSDKNLSSVSLVISDIEMPNMDGYTLTHEIRKDERMKALPVILHTSLSGVFNESITEKVGANRFVSKFKPDDLAREIMSFFTETE